MFKRLTIVLLLVVSGFSTALAFANNAEEKKLLRIFDEIWQYDMTRDPTYATYVGYPGQNGLWPDVSQAAVAADTEKRREFLAKLRKINRKRLGDDSLLDWQLVEKNLAGQVDSSEFPDQYILIHQRGGVQQGIAETLSMMPQRNRQDFQDQLTRLTNASAYIEQNIAMLREGLAKGITPPQITLRDVPQQIRNTIPEDVNQSPLLSSFTNFPDSISDEEEAALIAEAKRIITEQLYPAFNQLLVFMETDYIPNAASSIALSDMPDGTNWYNHRVKQFTTSSLTAKEIHELGLSEVKRIRAEMDKVIADSGFEGSFSEFTHFLRTDKQFYMTSAEDLLRGYRDIAKRADPELAKLFGTLPRLPYGVIAIPDYAAKSQTTAYYWGGSNKTGRAGYFYANTYALNTRPTWEMEALTLHEAMPGHHLQISISQELPETHPLRQNLSYTGFVEGWGLYAESLGTEMGFYTDPYNRFGQLSYEMWRAVRLVVDTGMHMFGWDRQRAIDFFASNTAKSLHDIEVEIDRYISWPGQALAYKLGELKFKELRAQATEKLGDKFDVREFHDQLLNRGALPLDILEQRINAWILSRASK
ncbi:MAG: hypothetical protein ABS23_01345 [SAR92 bacterium BACL16 MAG-120619-bin48]|jgi:uncharacterized protein (DUF885 family)|nr:MAG: hypothetical protein ABS23_01345 [SAR92 bacterium BACL16 MAG-120619-bin48]